MRGAAPMKTNMASTASSSLAVGVADAQRAQVVVALGLDRLRAVRTSMFGERRDLLDQVVRHRLLQRVAAHEHRHLCRRSR